MKGCFLCGLCDGGSALSCFSHGPTSLSADDDFKNNWHHLGFVSSASCELCRMSECGPRRGFGSLLKQPTFRFVASYGLPCSQAGVPPTKASAYTSRAGVKR